MWKQHVRDVWSCGSTHLASSKQRKGAVIMHSTLQHGAKFARGPDLCMERAGGTQTLFRKHVWFYICSSQFSERYYPRHKSIGHHGYSCTVCARQHFTPSERILLKALTKPGALQDKTKRGLWWIVETSSRLLRSHQ